MNNNLVYEKVQDFGHFVLYNVYNKKGLFLWRETEKTQPTEHKNNLITAAIMEKENRAVAFTDEEKKPANRKGIPDETAIEIKRLHKEGLRNHIIATQLGVSAKIVCNVVRGNTHKHIT